jgi:hypothetical protein
METKINIAKILKNKPEGTKLWTDMFGSVTLYVVTDACDAFQVKHHNKDPWFDEDGKLYKEGVLCIYPSKSMRNWEKFSWKKGDVLISDCGFMCIFKEWASDDYTKFNGCYFDGMPNTETAKYSKVDNNIAYGYIRDIENRCGGKLNLETLEIEKQTKFKDGDIVFMKGIKGGYFANCIFILRSEYKDGDERAFYYAFYNADDKFTRAEYGYTRVHYSLRPATVSEKLQLFDALAKKGKRWDAEKKKVVDLPKKCEFKPFDKVICRDSDADIWKASFFSHYDERAYFPFFCNNCGYKYCLPYNDETAKLIGTTNNVEG